MPTLHRACQRAGIDERIPNVPPGDRGHGSERDLCLLHQLGAARLYAGISRQIGRAAQRILDRPPRQLARLDHIVGGGGVIGFGILDHVHDVRLHGHLHVDAGGQMRARRVRVAADNSTGRCVSAARCESPARPTVR